MRTLFAFLAVGLLAVAPACGGDDSSSKQDMSTTSVTHDFAGSTADLHAFGKEMCADVLVAANQCSDTACVAMAEAMGTITAQNKFNALFACAAGQCGPPDSGVDIDGGAGTCSGPSDTSAACAACVKAQASSAACSTYSTACFQDTSTS